MLPIAPGSARGGRKCIDLSVALCKSNLLYEGHRPVWRLCVTRFRRVAFLREAKMPNVLIAACVSPGRCPGLWATIGLSARHNEGNVRLMAVPVFGNCAARSREFYLNRALHRHALAGLQSRADFDAGAVGLARGHGAFHVGIVLCLHIHELLPLLIGQGSGRQGNDILARRGE